MYWHQTRDRAIFQEPFNKAFIELIVLTVK